MSVAPAIETYTCPVEGCEFAFTGDPDTVKFERRQHELVHDVDEFFDGKAAEPTPEPEEEKPTRALERWQDQRDSLLARELTVRCADCFWESTGPTLEARRAWAEHRRDEHGDESGMESIARVTKPLTQREIKHGGRKRKVADTRPRERKERAVTEVQERGTRGRWTRERIIETIQAFAREHGRPPSFSDWKKSGGDEHPSAPTVAYVFDSWSAGIEAAGFTPGARNGPAVEAVPPPGARTGGTRGWTESTPDSGNACARASLRGARRATRRGRPARLRPDRAQAGHAR